MFHPVGVSVFDEILVQFFCHRVTSD